MDQDIVEGLKPHRDRNKDVVACIDDFEANNNRMRCDICRKRGLPVGSGFVGRTCKQKSSGTESNGRSFSGRKRTPTPRSPTNAARRQLLARLPVLDGSSRRRHLIKKIWMHSLREIGSILEEVA